MNYEINDHDEIKSSLIDDFKSRIGSKRTDVVKGAKEMKAQIGSHKDSASKQYLRILDEIIAEYSKKPTVDELLDKRKK